MGHGVDNLAENPSLFQLFVGPSIVGKKLGDEAMKTLISAMFLGRVTAVANDIEFAGTTLGGALWTETDGGAFGGVRATHHERRHGAVAAAEPSGFLQMLKGGR